MKLIVAFLAASVASVAHAADQCDLTKLSPLLTNPAVKTCTEQSKYTFVPPTRPTDEQLAAICKSDTCKQVLGAVAAMGLPDCLIGEVSVKKDLIERVTTGCAALANGGSSATPAPSATQAPTTTTPAPSATTTATPIPSATKNATATNTTTTAPPASTTAAPSDASAEEDTSVEEEESSSSGSGDFSIEQVDTVEETSEPETAKPKTPVPSPKPTSSAIASAVVATSAVCAASFASAVVLM